MSGVDTGSACHYNAVVTIVLPGTDKPADAHRIKTLTDKTLEDIIQSAISFFYMSCYPNKRDFPVSRAIIESPEKLWAAIDEYLRHPYVPTCSIVVFSLRDPNSWKIIPFFDPTIPSPGTNSVPSSSYQPTVLELARIHSDRCLIEDDCVSGRDIDTISDSNFSLKRRRSDEETEPETGCDADGDADDDDSGDSDDDVDSDYEADDDLADSVFSAKRPPLKNPVAGSTVDFSSEF